jgi:hypothetical protein
MRWLACQQLYGIVSGASVTPGIWKCFREIETGKVEKILLCFEDRAFLGSGCHRKTIADNCQPI